MVLVQWNIMMMDDNEFFRQTIQHLARSLANIDPTPWEKVSQYMFILACFATLPQ